MFLLYNNRKKITIFFILILLFLLFMILTSQNANAEAIGTGKTFKTIADHVKVSCVSFGRAMQDGVRWLFSTLAIITLVWNFGQIALKGGEISGIFHALVRTILTVGFFWWLISNSNTLLFNCMSQFTNFAASVSGTAVLDPSEFVSSGLDIATEVFKNAFLTKPDLFNIPETILNLVVAILVSFFLYIIFIVTGFNMMMAMINFYFIAYLGYFLLGLAGSPYTRDMSLSYLKALLGAGIMYFGMIVSANLGGTLLNMLITDVNLAEGILDNLGTYINLLVGAYAVYLLISKLPTMLAGLVSSANFGAGMADAGAAAGKVVGTAATTTGALAGGALGGAIGSAIRGGVSGFKTGGIGKAATGAAMGLATGGLSGSMSGAKYAARQIFGFNAQHGGKGGGSGNSAS